MRGIKFRAWITLSDYDDDDNDKDYHGMAKKISVHSDGSIGFTVSHAQDIFGSEITDRARDNDTLYEIDYEWCNWEGQVELMQYTGLKDKNGVEIYEGDILEFPYWQNNYTYADEVDEIKFIDSQFVLHNVGPLASWNLKSQVIGNIYENPDLLAPATAEKNRG